MEDIKTKSADGYTMSQISETFYPDCSPGYIRGRLREKWRQWTREQDQKLLELHPVEGDNWAAISSKLPGGPRNAEEVQTRFGRLKKDEDVRMQNKQSRGRDQYNDEDNDDIRRRLAQGMSCGELVGVKGFQNLTRQNLAKHAKLICAGWSKDDDKKL